MARKPRVHFSGALYHVMSRGNQGQAIFKDDWDRERYLDILKENENRLGYRLYAYVLMGTGQGDGLGGQRVGRVEQSRAGKGFIPRFSGVKQRFRETGRGVGEKSGAAWSSGNALRRIEERATPKKM